MAQNQEQESATFGLPEIWNEVLVWAEQHAVTNELALIIDTCRLLDHETSGLGTVLEHLISDRTRKQLAVWADYHPTCASIHRLAEACYRDPTPLELHKPLPSSKKPEELFKNNLKKMYLLALLTRKPSETKIEYSDWFEMIILWVLAQAAMRTEQGNTLDGYLQEVSSKIRKVFTSEDHIDLSSIIWTIDPTSPLDLSQINMRLNGRASWVASKHRDRSEVRFMNALTAIAEGKDNKIEDIQARGARLYHPTSHAQPRSQAEQLTSVNTDTLDKPEQLLLFGTDSETAYVTTEVDETDSYTHQRLSSLTTWRLKSELTHFLPWSWDQLIPTEIQHLGNTVDQWLTSDIELTQLLASLTWLAIHTGRTLIRILDIELDVDPQGEWRLNQNTGELHRLPPKRQSDWVPDGDCEAWLRPAVDHQILVLPSVVAQTLIRLLKSHPHCQVLGDLWGSRTSETIEKSFADRMTGPLARVRSGMLANVLGRRVFESTGNSHLARMTGFHPQAGMGGAFAYGNWDQRLVQRLLHPHLSEEDINGSSEIIGIGSRFEPLDNRLVDSIQSAGNRLKAIRQSDPVAFHNAYTIYLVTALLAATGARPVHDPFESPSHFNHDMPCVFVNDKNDQGFHQGRLCPIPRALSQIVDKQYSKHLRHLAKALELAGSELTAPVSALAEGKPAKLPYFFLLDAASLTWKSISVTTIKEQALFDWPLPANLFRQRLIKKLLRAGIDQEIINGWMGHAENGMTPYGDFSIRCWLKDYQDSRDAFEAIYDELDFDAFSTWRQTPTLKTGASIRFSTRRFGISSRTYERKRRLSRSLEKIREEIRDILGEREITELTDAETEQLTRNIIFHDSGRVRTDAYLRQSVYENLLKQAWRKKGERCPIRNRLLQVAPEPWIISSLSPVALSVYPNALSKARDILSETNVMQSGRQDCLTLGAVMLAFENRISNTTLLENITIGQHFRLVKFRNRFYLEYSEDLDPQNHDAPIERHRIEPKTAHLLDRGLSAKRVVTLSQKRLPRSLQPLCEKLAIDTTGAIATKDLIQRISEIMDQVNAIEFPGTVSAFLSGRVPSTSLDWRDWVRLETGKILELPDSDEDEALTEATSILPWESPNILSYRSSIVQIRDKETLQINADRFQKAIGRLIYRYEPKNKKQTLAGLGNEIKSWDGKVSSSLLLFAQWLEEIIRRGKRVGQGDYAASSPSRYFTGLNIAFAELAYNADLLSMEEPEITKLYQEILEYRGSRESNSFSVKRLLEFHQYAEKQGVESPDWAELGISYRSRNVSPGLILEDDYQIAAAILLSNSAFDDDFRQRSCLLLLLCYRFGLRRKEALGLRRHDICHESDQYYLLLRNNSFRELKNTISRRIVPQVMQLKPFEKKLIEQRLSHVDAIRAEEDGAYLFANDGEKTPTDDDLLARVVNQVLKASTGNPRTILHHARHTYANITAPALYNLSLGSWRRLTRPFDFESIRTITLGPVQGSRLRNSWASARLLGHGSPRTQMISYQHFYGDWSNEFTSCGRSFTKKKLPHVVDLDTVPRHSQSKVSSLGYDSLKYVNSDLITLLKCLSLVSCGKTFDQAGRRLLMNPDHTRQMEVLALTIGKRITLPRKTGHSATSNEAPLEYLARIKPGGWRRIFAHLLKKRFNPENYFDETITLDIAAESIGMTRQLTLSREIHFKIVSAMLDFYGISSKYYDILQRIPSDHFRELAKTYGLTPVLDTVTHPSGKKIRVDPAYDPATGRSQHRSEHCALDFKRNSDIYIRNSFEMAALYIAYIAALHFQAETSL
ncbi:MAG: tyrosine-type recombinase/integrase [Candidatus Thiodiazotropha sp.]